MFRILNIDHDLFGHHHHLERFQAVGPASCTQQVSGVFFAPAEVTAEDFHGDDIQPDPLNTRNDFYTIYCAKQERADS